jgi:hypothetical protein
MTAILLSHAPGSDSTRDSCVTSADRRGAAALSYGPPEATSLLSH